uniref:Cytokine inducible SH2-containing protein n=1 Tax=Mus musculus TaxID=10090 RepID=E9Q273_MOUSE
MVLCVQGVVLGFYYSQRGPAAPTEDAGGYIPSSRQHPPQLPVHTVSQNHPWPHQRADRVRRF